MQRSGEETIVTQTYHGRGFGAGSAAAGGNWRFFENSIIFGNYS